MTRLALALLLLSELAASARADDARADVAGSEPPWQQSSRTTTALDASWLCRPGRQDACSVDLATTIVKADGSFTREEWKGRSKRADRLLLRVSDRVDRSHAVERHDGRSGRAQRHSTAVRAIRFGLPLYAPLYRQVTLAGLRQAIAGGGGGFSLSKGPQYDDVRDAWRHYLERDNRGRGVVLIGHSQGSYILTELIRQEIDGKPVQSRLVSALLLGATFAVPNGKDVGGSLQQIPLCRKPAQTGCVVTYVSFRSTSPPPANTRFGKVTEPGMSAACTNPAALGGGTAPLSAYLAADGRMIVNTATVPGSFPSVRSRRRGSACPAC